jgi:hypothetical protein
MSNASSLTPLFDACIGPSAVDRQEPFRRAHIADEHGLNLITLKEALA